MTLQQQIRANRWRTTLLLAMFIAFIILVLAGLSLALDLTVIGILGLIAIGYGVWSWFAAGRMVARLTGAHPITRAEHPELWQAVDAAAVAAGLARTPDVYIIPDPAPNALAAGRTPAHAYVAATTGLLEVMGPRELRAVMAHEIAHVRNRDVRLMSLAAVLAGVLLLITDIAFRAMLITGSRDNPYGLIIGVVGIVLAPVAALMMQAALSRRREFLADASAAEITGDAEGMARALAVLQSDHRTLRRVGQGTAHLYIESPLDTTRPNWITAMMGTHPPMSERIAALEQAGGFRLDHSFLARLDPVGHALGPLATPTPNPVRERDPFAEPPGARAVPPPDRS